ncbi:uncharacterized protein EV154DRAFT_557152 [Mucor mucedo]|uniref:uncharacterized protein n=1 Tax=Mucor mucedo TaxID=29922 RepID=UPI00221F0CC3|nr:uncharacterized protein EV154DRAFT_557152 [Mucor mucedo]KAI7866221.1 hypothetical protein EV154DRAFT_557152 [Mucor mucedo]
MQQIILQKFLNSPVLVLMEDDYLIALELFTSDSLSHLRAFPSCEVFCKESSISFGIAILNYSCPRFRPVSGIMTCINAMLMIIFVYGSVGQKIMWACGISESLNPIMLTWTYY